MSDLPPKTWRDLRLDALARLDAADVDDAPGKLRWLLAHLLGGRSLAAADLRLGEIPSEKAAAEFSHGVARLLAHEPVQYVIGETDFMGLTFRCSPAALIPRPETERLAELAIDWLRRAPRPADRPLRVVDVGTGTGCLACAIKAACPDAEVTALDISADALALARRNAARLRLAIAFRQNDLLDGLPPESADLVVSNPPYVATRECDALPPTVRLFEPRLALDGGPDGLRLISRLAAGAASVLVSGGGLLLEIGEDQAETVLPCLNQTNQFLPPEILSDYAGRSRLVRTARRPRSGKAPSSPAPATNARDAASPSSCSSR
jgi:release factor glutamine methyltransferase